jgi:hypothetical protein
MGADASDASHLRRLVIDPGARPSFLCRFAVTTLISVRSVSPFILPTAPWRSTPAHPQVAAIE